MDDLLNTKQAAEYCGMNPRNMTETVKDGRLHYVKQDNHRQYCFAHDDVERFQATRPEYVKNKKPDKATAAEFQKLTDSCVA